MCKSPEVTELAIWRNARRQDGQVIAEFKGSTGEDKAGPV